MSTLNKYPIKDGWLHLKFCLVPGHELTEENLKRFATFYKPIEEYEFGVVRVGKRVGTVVLRRKRVEAPKE